MTSLPESSSITMVLDYWTNTQVEQISPSHRINGYPWHLRAYRGHNGARYVSLICDKSSESELWQCTATITSHHYKAAWALATKGIIKRQRRELITRTDIRTINSWNKHSQDLTLNMDMLENEEKVQVFIEVKDDSSRWRLRPILDPFNDQCGTLVIGEDKKRIQVNKESLASQSSFFNSLFNGDFKEKNMSEIVIGDVEYEEFLNIIKMVYGFDGCNLTDKNVHRVVELADRFDLKIVEDRVVSYLLSSSSSISICKKLLIAEQFNIPFLKDNLLSRHNKFSLKELRESAEYEQLSRDTHRSLLEKSF